MFGSDEMFSSDSNTRGLSDALRRSEATKQGSDSFSYKAPVQPKKAATTPAKTAAATPAARSTVLHFCQVTAYKQFVTFLFCIFLSFHHLLFDVWVFFSLSLVIFFCDTVLVHHRLTWGRLVQRLRAVWGARAHS